MTYVPDTFFLTSVFSVALVFSLLLTPVMRRLAIRFNIFDHPSTPVKTHGVSTPYLGGVAILLSFSGTLLLLRWFTHFPTGTLNSLRAVLVGGGFIAFVGLVDDIKQGGLDFRWKFLCQFLGVFLLLLFDIRIKFVEPKWLAVLFTGLWVTAVTNAFNLIDIMDGLSSSQALVACLGFLFVSMPGEELYVNLAVVSLAGACLGFLPYNLSRSKKIFMGDGGSLFIGFTLASVSLGMSYSRESELGVLAPVLILGFPLYDMTFVSVLRILQGRSPFRGSKDHLALKLRALGLRPLSVVSLMGGVAALFCFVAFLTVRGASWTSLSLLAVLVLVGFFALWRLRRVQVP